VVTTESCGMADLIEDSHDGVFVIPGNADSLASAVTKLCLDGELRQRLGNAAQEKMKRYTWGASARRHEMVFNRAMGVNVDAAVVTKAKTSTAEDARVMP
jgi:glycogen(starch) synthase